MQPGDNDDSEHNLTHSYPPLDPYTISGNLIDFDMDTVKCGMLMKTIVANVLRNHKIENDTQLNSPDDEGKWVDLAEPSKMRRDMLCKALVKVMEELQILEIMAERPVMAEDRRWRFEPFPEAENNNTRHALHAIRYAEDLLETYGIVANKAEAREFSKQLQQELHQAMIVGIDDYLAQSKGQGACLG